MRKLPFRYRAAQSLRVNIPADNAEVLLVGIKNIPGFEYFLTYWYLSRNHD